MDTDTPEQLERHKRYMDRLCRRKERREKKNAEKKALRARNASIILQNSIEIKNQRLERLKNPKPNEERITPIRKKLSHQKCVLFTCKKRLSADQHPPSGYDFLFPE